MLPEAVLHVSELVDALDAFGLGLGVDEAAEGLLELGAARAVGHSAKAGAGPVDLARFGVEGRRLGVGVGVGVG